MAKCECTPECPKRSATCKFDGSCDKWDDYVAEKKVEDAAESAKKKIATFPDAYYMSRKRKIGKV